MESLKWTLLWESRWLVHLFLTGYIQRHQLHSIQKLWLWDPELHNCLRLNSRRTLRKPNDPFTQPVHCRIQDRNLRSPANYSQIKQFLKIDLPVIKTALSVHVLINCRRRMIESSHNENWPMIHGPWTKSTERCLALTGRTGPLIGPLIDLLLLRWQRARPRHPTVYLTCWSFLQSAIKTQCGKWLLLNV